MELYGLNEMVGEIAARALILMEVAVSIATGTYFVACWIGRSPAPHSVGTFVLAFIHPLLGVVVLLWDLVSPIKKMAE